MSAAKRRRTSDDVELANQHDDEAQSEDYEEEHPGSEGDSDSDGEASSPDTADEITVAKWAKSKKTLKRKRRATEPSHFGETLQSLLTTDAPSSLPLSLKPGITRKRNDEKLEFQAKKLLQVQKKDKEDKGRIRDVIGGWGGESERALRKVAQRGVVKLFNAIQQSQAVSSTTVERSKAARGAGKPTLLSPLLNSSSSGKRKGKEKYISSSTNGAVEKNEFFDMIRSGGLVSKA